MTTTRIAIDIECGKTTCGECSCREDDYCELFGVHMVEDAEDVFLRCAPCLAAQGLAEDMMLKVAVAKAQGGAA